MNWELIIWLTGIMLFTYWLNYIMGRPNAEDIQKVDMSGILFWVPLWLAKCRLNSCYQLKKKVDEIREQFFEEIKVTGDFLVQHQLIRDQNREIFRVGREMFTWERSITCPICLHWWLTVIFGSVCLTFNLLHAREDYLLAGFTYLLNHFFIRKIS